jgi:hypothetical protein
MSASNILFRCSSLGYLMTEPRSKSETLSETCKTHLTDVFVSAKYGRNTDIFNRYTAKGMMVEEDSLTLYSRYKEEIYFKNKERVENFYISGCPDIILKDMIIDIKSSWDIYTFFRNNNSDKVNKNYYWQLQGYMALCDKETSKLAYCLVNTPDMLIQDQKRKLLWQMGLIDDTNKDYEQACIEIDKLSVYDDIPMEEKVIEIVIKRNQADIDRLYERIEVAREYMDSFLFKTKKTIVM